MTFAYFFADLFFYWGHRLAHHPRFYWVHKVHHEAVNTTVYNAMSVHPLEWWLIDVMTVTPGVLILWDKFHVVSYLSFMLWSQIGNLDDHFGYEFPWMFTKILPWSANNTFHNYHHLVNIGNFSAQMIWWDSIFGTCVNYVGDLETQEGLKKDKTAMTQIKIKAA